MKDALWTTNQCQANFNSAQTFRMPYAFGILAAISDATYILQI